MEDGCFGEREVEGSTGVYPMPRMQGQAGEAGSSSSAAASPQDSPWLRAQALVGISLKPFWFQFPVAGRRERCLPCLQSQKASGDQKTFMVSWATRWIAWFALVFLRA